MSSIIEVVIYFDRFDQNNGNVDKNFRKKLNRFDDCLNEGQFIGWSAERSLRLISVKYGNGP